jgi:adenylylsulfate kinase
MKTGAVVWITGLPSSGKSTLARSTLAQLEQHDIAAALLDGDEVRRSIVPAPGYTPPERDHLYETLTRLALLLAGQGLVVLVAATAHQRRYRDHARELAPRFAEVYVKVSPEVCATRDTKGLYASARRGDAPELPGAGVEYEPPEHPEVVATGGEDDAAIASIIRWLYPEVF